MLKCYLKIHMHLSLLQREKDPEIDIVKKYCKINKLSWWDVNWKDYNDNIDYLMSVKKSNTSRKYLFMCCKKLKMNINVLLDRVLILILARWIN